MIRQKKIGSLLLAMAGLMFAGSAAAQAETLHLDINCLTISAFNSQGVAGFTGSNFTGSLHISTNTNSVMSVEDDGDPNDGYTGHITNITGSVNLVGGVLSGGTVTIDVATGALTDSYTYSVVAGSGDITCSLNPHVVAALGYSINGDTDQGSFANTDYGGVDVTPWYNAAPLSGNFVQFHYYPDMATGVDMKSDMDIRIYTPLPSSLWGGMLGVGVLSIYHWRRGAAIRRVI